METKIISDTIYGIHHYIYRPSSMKSSDFVDIVLKYIKEIHKKFNQRFQSNKNIQKGIKDIKLEISNKRKTE